MRFVVPLAAAAALAALSGCGPFGGSDTCEIFGRDLDLAVLKPTSEPDADDHAPLHYGMCSIVSTKKFDVHFPGWDRHTEHTVAGRLFLDIGGPKQLDAVKTSMVRRPGVRTTPLPALGPDAFLVTRTQSTTPPSQGAANPSDPTEAMPLPATAWWAIGRDGTYASVSATRDGATVADSQRATERLAVLVNRRTVQSSN